jgi:hypothetical protein
MLARRAARAFLYNSVPRLSNADLHSEAKLSIRIRCLFVVAIVTAGVGLSAHHSISAVYDSSQAVTVDGVVTQFRFVNPHPFLVVEVRDAGRTPEVWHMELDNRGELSSIGMTADTIRPGDRVRVTGSRSRTESRSMYVRKLLRSSDGFEYEQVGSSPRVKVR